MKIGIIQQANTADQAYNKARLAERIRQVAQESDQIVLERLGQALPDREIVGVDCRSLIRQHGSLHCATMQIPRGFINKNKWQQ